MDLHEKWRNFVASLDDKSPKIKIVVGVVGLIGAGIAAAVAATKIKDDVVEETKDFENIKKVRMSAEHPEECTEEEKVAEDIAACYSDKDYAKDVLRTGLRYGWKVVKRFGIPVAMAAASTVLIFNGANVLSTRLAGTVEALATVTSAYTNYRQGVIEKYGEKVDEELRLGIHEETVTIEETVVDENGKEKVVKKKEKVTVGDKDPNLASPWAMYVDERCTQYMPDIVQMEMYLRSQEKYLNAVLKACPKKYVTIGELYDVLGATHKERTQAALVAGWTYDENDTNCDNYIDLRMKRVYKMSPDGKFKPYVLIDPNVEGSIYDKLPKALGYSDDKATV